MVFKFLGAEFEIEFNADIWRGEWGECDYDKRVIRVAKGTLMGETLLHECIHAICDRLFEEKDEAKDEQRVNMIASIVEAVMRDNPEVLRYLVRRLPVERKHASGK
jgi:hypothetical protein